MYLLDLEEEVENTPARKDTGARSIDTPPKKRGRLVVLEVPRFSKSAQPSNTETTRTHAFISAKTGLGDLWIGQKDIPWLIAYIADDANTEGLPWCDVIIDMQGPYTRAEGGEQYVLSYHCTMCRSRTAPRNLPRPRVG